MVIETLNIISEAYIIFVYLKWKFYDISVSKRLILNYMFINYKNKFIILINFLNKKN